METVSQLLEQQLTIKNLFLERLAVNCGCGRLQASHLEVSGLMVCKDCCATIPPGKLVPLHQLSEVQSLLWLNKSLLPSVKSQWVQRFQEIKSEIDLICNLVRAIAESSTKALYSKAHQYLTEDLSDKKSIIDGTAMSAQLSQGELDALLGLMRRKANFAKDTLPLKPENASSLPLNIELGLFVKNLSQTVAKQKLSLGKVSKLNLEKEQTQLLAEQRAVKLSLNLTAHYVSEWKWIDGIREIFQNFMDETVRQFPGWVEWRDMREEVDGPVLSLFPHWEQEGQVYVSRSNYVSYNSTQQSLSFVNKGTFGPKCLLLGPTAKRKEFNALGGFGQGMKLSWVSLLRKGTDRDPFKLKIRSGGRQFIPHYRKWQQFEGAHVEFQDDVLYVEMRPSQPWSDSTEFTVFGVTQAEFEEVRFLSLSLFPREAKPLTGAIKLSNDNYVLVSEHERVKNRLFRNGVLISLSNGLGHSGNVGYNLKDIKLGRDRRSCEVPSQLNQLASKLHVDVLNSETILMQQKDALGRRRQQMGLLLQTHFEKVFQMLQAGNPVIHPMYGYSNPAIGNRYLNRLRQNYPGKEVQPVCQAGSVHYVLSIYKLPDSFYYYAVVNDYFFHLLVKSDMYESLDNRKYKLLSNLQKLDQDQLRLVQSALVLVADLCPELRGYGLTKRLGVSCKNGSTLVVKQQTLASGDKRLLALEMLRLHLA